MFIRVDLPAPFSPSSACISPGGEVEVNAIVRQHAGKALGDPPRLKCVSRVGGGGEYLAVAGSLHLFFVWDADRRGWGRAAYGPCQHDDGQQIGNGADDLVREGLAGADLEAALLDVYLQRLSQPEEEGRAPRAQRGPLAENERGEGDETAPSYHARAELRHLNNKIGASQPCYRATDDNVCVAHEEDVDAHRIGGARVLSDGARPQAPAREVDDETA